MPRIKLYARCIEDPEWYDRYEIWCEVLTGPNAGEHWQVDVHDMHIKIEGPGEVAYFEFNGAVRRVRVRYPAPCA